MQLAYCLSEHFFEIFGCTKYALDTARKMKAISPGILVSKKKKHLQSRIDTKLIRALHNISLF